MLDKNRLTRPLQGESTFRIFYELLDSGDTSLLQELNLDSWIKNDDENLFLDLEQEVCVLFLCFFVFIMLKLEAGLISPTSLI